MTRDEHAAGRSRVWLIVALGSLSAFGPLCLDMYLPALPVLPGELNSTAAAAQLSLSACIIGLAVGQVITGPLSDRLAAAARCCWGWPCSRWSARCAR